MASFDDLTLAPCDMSTFSRGNLYKNVSTCIIRARQIELDRFEDLSGKLNDWLNYVGEFPSDEAFNDDAQDEISQFFENLKKPELVAMDEFKCSKLKVEEVSEDIGGSDKNL